jgi:hypothetical protein
LNTPHRIFLAAVLISSLLTCACIKDVAKTLGEIQIVHAELTKTFGEEVNVKVNEADRGLVITVSFINSALNQKTPEERFKRAAEAAKVVKTRYVRINRVNTIWVGFVRRQTRMFVFHYTQSMDYYPFDKNANWMQPPAPTTTATAGVVLDTVANYSSDSDETNVFAYGIQLEGEPGGDGVTVQPNYRIAGNVNVRRASPPKIVQFDFASYSSTPQFEQSVPIAFVADGKIVFQTKGTFHGNDAQFCYLPVPYPAFRKMIAARNLQIKLGAKEYSLTPRQFETVKKMGDYVAE